MSVTKTVRTRGRNIRQMEVSADGEWVYLPTIAEVGVPVTKGNIDNGWIVASRLCRLPLNGDGPREAIALDPRGRAVADIDGLALRPDGKGLAIAAAGTHEIVALGFPLPFEAFGGPADHINPSLLGDPARFRRIPVGGRPMALRYLPDGRRVAVANYLLNAVQVVDLEKAQIEKTIALGGPAQASLARKGEAIFHDAQRSFNQWYSCGSCHSEGHTGGGSFDTFNDGSYRTLKKTLSLRGIAQTGPWTWHGHRSDLKELIHDSMVKSMQGPEPAAEDLEALTAYVASIPFAPAPKARDPKLAEAAKRGAKLFKSRGCDTCHPAPNYTAGKAFAVGLESAADAYPGFNPPSLRGVGTRAPYLHDGRADTLEEVLGKHHSPSKLTGKPDFTEAEMSEVVAFLRSL
jgi:cytochrome c peroxidase